MSMEDLPGMLARLAMTGAIVALVVVMLRRRGARPGGAHGPAALAHDAGAELVVPVRRLLHTASIRGECSTLSPRLRITGDGLEFKVIHRVQALRFADIREVHVGLPPLAGGVRIFFRRPHWSGLPLPGYGLIADVPDAATARAVLRALPRSLPLTEAARRLSDG